MVRFRYTRNRYGNAALVARAKQCTWDGVAALLEQLDVEGSELRTKLDGEWIPTSPPPVGTTPPMSPSTKDQSPSSSSSSSTTAAGGASTHAGSPSADSFETTAAERERAKREREEAEREGKLAEERLNVLRAESEVRVCILT